MGPNGRAKGWVVAVAVGVLGGCAPSFGGSSFGPGLHIGFSPAAGLRIAPASCLLLGTSTPGAFTHGVGGAAIAGAQMQQVAQIQSQYAFGAQTPAARMERSKSLVAGGC